MTIRIRLRTMRNPISFVFVILQILILLDLAFLMSLFFFRSNCRLVRRLLSSEMPRFLLSIGGLQQLSTFFATEVLPYLLVVSVLVLLSISPPLWETFRRYDFWRFRANSLFKFVPHRLVLLKVFFPSMIPHLAFVHTDDIFRGKAKFTNVLTK